jgi:hypothetical protein
MKVFANQRTRESLLQVTPPQSAILPRVGKLYMAVIVVQVLVVLALWWVSQHFAI